MTLVAGTRLGPYEITATLGAGGMGEVYRARDARLKREVALKVLPDTFANELDRLARFQREAEVLASLNHPHIAAIYGLEESNGTPFLVLELVEGETLADRIQHGPVPVEEALQLALQIAEALEGAHEQGIVHRDLKPANIKVRPDGTVKVLDFGLAKALAPVAQGFSPAGDLSQSPTITSAAMATGAGVILGTAAYMAPEQAKGRPADRRADIWAFGCVLYEMLAGRRAFAGEDVSDTLAAVLRAEADLDLLPASTPARLRRALKVCLQKDLRGRASDIHDVRLALEGAFDVDHPAAATAPAPTRIAPRWIAAGVIVAVLAAGVLGLWMRASDEAPPPPVRRFAVILPASVELPRTEGSLLAISPDGQTLVYRAREAGVFRLYRRGLDQLEAAPIPGTEGAEQTPFFSPDGQWLAFPSGGTLMKVALAGGRPVPVGDLPASSIRGGSWGADDTIIVAAFAAGLASVPAGGGEAMPIATPDDGRQYWYPQILPGGRAVLFTASFPAVDAGDVMVLDLESGMRRTLLAGGIAGQYVPTGHLVFVRGGDLWAARFDPERLEVVGDAAVVQEGVRVEVGGAVQMAIAGDGSLAYIPPGAVAYRHTLVWVDRQGREEAINVPPRGYQYFRLSPDGASVALHVREAESDIWTWDLARETLARTSFNSSVYAPNDVGPPVWTPDGTRIAFGHADGNVYWQAADGSGVPERLTEGAERRLFPRSFSSDGRQLLLAEAGAAGTIHLLDLEAGSGLQLLPGMSCFNPEVSPDGRWLAYQSSESGRNEVYVRPFPDVNSGRWQISTAGGTGPLWSRDGRELFYLAGAGSIVGVPIDTTTGFAVGRPAVLIEGDYVAGPGRTYDVSPDGRRFLMLRDLESDAGEPSSHQIILVQNWFEELKRLVPGD